MLSPRGGGGGEVQLDPSDFDTERGEREEREEREGERAGSGRKAISISLSPTHALAANAKM